MWIQVYKQIFKSFVRKCSFVTILLSQGPTKGVSLSISKYFFCSIEAKPKLEERKIPFFTEKLWKAKDLGEERRSIISLDFQESEETSSERKTLGVKQLWSLQNKEEVYIPWRCYSIPPWTLKPPKLPKFVIHQINQYFESIK